MARPARVDVVDAENDGVERLPIDFVVGEGRARGAVGIVGPELSPDDAQEARIGGGKLLDDLESNVRETHRESPRRPLVGRAGGEYIEAE